MDIGRRGMVRLAAALVAGWVVGFAAAAGPAPPQGAPGGGDLNLWPRRPEVATPYAGPAAAGPAGAVAKVRDGARPATGPQGADHGGLPPSANWALMIVGVSMIGAALRGFMMANRAIARLQPDQMD